MKNKMSKTDFIFISQVFILYIIIIALIFNLTYKYENKELWISLLSYSLGCLFPIPLKHDDKFRRLSQKNIL